MLELPAAEAADMIALGWTQDLSSGKAAVIREVVPGAKSIQFTMARL